MKFLKLSYYEIIKIFRNPGIFILMLLLPILLAYLGVSFYPQNLVGDYKIAFYNEDKSLLGQFGFTFLKQFLKWENSIELKTQDEYKEAIKTQKFDSIIIMPKGFINDLKDRKQTKLYVIPNSDKMQDSTSIYTVIKTLFKELAGIPDTKGSTVQFLMSGGITVDKNRKAPEVDMLVPNPKTGSVDYNDGKKMGFSDILAPAVAVIMLLLFSMIGVGNSIANTKEIGLYDIYKSNGLKVHEFILFKFSAYFVVGIISSLIAWYMYRFFGVNSRANEVELIIFIMINVMAFTAFGIFFSSFARTSRSSALILTALTGGMILFGDVILPIPQDSIMKSVAGFMPIKYSIDAWRKMSILGFGLGDIGKELIILIGFGVVSLVLSMIITSVIENK